VLWLGYCLDIVCIPKGAFVGDLVLSVVVVGGSF
jgi:hypothetical protein